MRIAVVGEGISERGRRMRGDAFAEVRDEELGAAEVLVQRAAANLIGGAAVVIEPSRPRDVEDLSRRAGEVAVLVNSDSLVRWVITTLEPIGRARDRGADMMVVFVDQEPPHQAEQVEAAVASARSMLKRGGALLLCVPAPEFEALFAWSKNAVENGLALPQCVYQPIDASTKERFRDAVQAAGGRLPTARDLARIARYLPVATIPDRSWATLVMNLGAALQA